MHFPRKAIHINNKQANNRNEKKKHAFINNRSAAVGCGGLFIYTVIAKVLLRVLLNRAICDKCSQPGVG